MINYRPADEIDQCRFCGSFDNRYDHLPWSDQHSFYCNCCNHGWLVDNFGDLIRVEDKMDCDGRWERAMKLNTRIVCPVCQAEGLTHTSEATDDYDWYICAKCATQFAIFYNGKLLVPDDDQPEQIDENSI